MKYSAKILFIAITVLYVLVMLVGLGLLFLPDSHVQNGLVSSEVVYVMMGLWLTIPLGLMGLTIAVIKTVKPRAGKVRKVKTTAYLAGAYLIGASLVLVVFLVMTMLGLLHPRQTSLTLTTPDCFHTYDGKTLVGTAPEITHGKLHEGHRLEVLSIPEHSRAGRYANAPGFRILDENGENVTNRYDITQNFGVLQINQRKITLSSPDKSKIYDGEPLQADPAVLTDGTLLDGHKLTVNKGSSITLPGTEPIRFYYRILGENGDDMTSQYEVIEDMGNLTVKPVEITVTTDSATKAYDGKKMSAPGWKHTAGTLLEGHTLQMEVTTVLEDVGTVNNEGDAHVLDADGQDVTHLYSIHYQYGTLKIQPIPLYITTGSAQKVYDGTALTCEEWELTRGELPQGYSIEVRHYPSQTQVGTLENKIEFIVTQWGKDVSHRFAVVGEYGTLTVQPRAITVRTDSAEKVYDGTPLSCNTFQIISGSLCQGDWVELTGSSITNVGYSENYVVTCTVYRKDENGNTVDVTASYRISYDFGMLKITAD